MSLKPTSSPDSRPAITRAQQRSMTRLRIVRAATDVFSELGFEGGSTREVARRAGVQQGLVTYHFTSKDELWRAAADSVFAVVQTLPLAGGDAQSTPDDPREIARALIAGYVKLAAAHPEIFRFLVAEGKVDSERMTWLVDTHLRPLYGAFRALGASFSVDEHRFPHALYALIGASSLLFAVRPEARHLTGVDPSAPGTVDRHAEYIADLFVARYPDAR
jgi:AcrR family transcriptional regulator